MSSATKRREVWLLAIGVVLLAALVIAVIANRTGSAGPDAAAPAVSGAPAAAEKEFGPLGDLSRRDAGDPRALGDVDAPVTMVVFSDFRCPYCAEFTKTVQPALIRDYVDTSKLRIEWRDQPIFGDQSELAARAGWAAAAQGRFWEFSGELYRSAPATGHPDLPIDTLVAHAKAAGVADLDRFRRETLDSTYDDELAADIAPTQQFGIIGVPAVVIDGEPIIGVQPTKVYAGVIDDHLP